jgi:hypothetical protein
VLPTNLKTLHVGVEMAIKDRVPEIDELVLG